MSRNFKVAPHPNPLPQVGRGKGEGSNLKRILLAVFLFVFATQPASPKDIELVLYKDFLEKLINKIFPINLTGEKISPVYKVYLNNPVLSIQPRYIQVDSVVNLSSVFGSQTFPSRCKLVPVYNSKNIELKVIEGIVDLKIDSNGEVINLGTIDLAQYISNIKIPLEINNISIKDKTVKSQCRNVTFQLLKDRVVVNSEIVIE